MSTDTFLPHVYLLHWPIACFANAMPGFDQQNVEYYLSKVKELKPKKINMLKIIKRKKLTTKHTRNIIGDTLSSNSNSEK
jgi:hypothetical protein